MSIRCVVLGGKGFIGSHLVEALLLRGHEVRVLGRPGSPALVSPEFIKDIDWLEGDLSNEDDVERAIKGREVCFHLACSTLPKTSNDDPAYDIRSNILGTVRLLDNACKHGLKKMVFVSSGGTVYGVPEYTPIDEKHPTNPICSYGITKLAIEKYLAMYNLLHGLDYAVLRLSNVFGERQRIAASQGAVAVFMGKALRGEVVEIWGDGSVVRDYVHVSDVISAMLLAMEYEGKERIFNIGSGVPTSLLDILESIEKVIGRKVEKRFLQGRPFDVPVNVLKIERAGRELGWVPRASLPQGLARMVEWLKRSCGETA